MSRSRLRAQGVSGLLASIVCAAVLAANSSILRAEDKPTTLPTTISMADAVPLQSVQTDDVEISFTDKLAPPLAKATVYFGGINRYDDPDDDQPVETTPVLGLKSGDDWKVVKIDGSVPHGMEWKYVGAGPGAGEIWAVLDTAVDKPAADIVLVHSVDGGKTFGLAPVHKPCRRASFFHFVMARGGSGGVGKVVVELTSACGKHQPGLYEYATTDGGKTWADKPTYVPDAMVPSDAVPDDEQPEVPDATKKASFGRRARSPRLSADVVILEGRDEWPRRITSCIGVDVFASLSHGRPARAGSHLAFSTGETPVRQTVERRPIRSAQ